MDRGLTEKQKRFIDYYIELGNATEAAKKARYKHPHVQGAQNLSKLRGFIDEKLAAKEDERIASQDEVLRFLTSVMRDEQDEEVVVVESIGDYMSEARIVKKKASIKDRQKAAELLGKRYGTFIEKQIIETVEDDRFIEALNAKAGDLIWDDDIDVEED